MAEDNEFTHLSGSEDSIDAAHQLIETAHRHIHLYTPQVVPIFHNAEELLNSLRRQIMANPRLHCHLLLPAAIHWRQSCPNLATLVERLSALELRIPPVNEPKDQAEFGQSFIIVDNRRFLLHTDPKRCSGYYSHSEPATARRLLDFIQALWEKSGPDIELRKLGI